METVVSAITHTPRAILSYLRDGEDGLSRLADRLKDEAHARSGRKFSKRTALYLPQSPFPPVLWQTECERCRFFKEGEPGEPGRCYLVGRSDDPFGGEAIHPRGWCGFYLPPTGEPAFEWFDERLRPSGASSVRGQYRTSLSEDGVESDSEKREREIPVTAEGHDDAGGAR